MRFFDNGEKEKLAAIAQKALDLLQQKQGEPPKTIQRFTTLTAYDESDAQYIRFLKSISESDMWRYYIQVKREQIMDLLAKFDANDEREKMRYVNWLEGIAFLNEGITAAERMELDEAEVA